MIIKKRHKLRSEMAELADNVKTTFFEDMTLVPLGGIFLEDWGQVAEAIRSPKNNTSH